MSNSALQKQTKIEIEAPLDAESSLPPSPSLRKNVAWTLFGNIIYAGSQWGLIVLLAKFGTADAVGVFALGLALTAPINLFTNMNLRQALATDSHRTYHFSDYIWVRAAGLLVFIACIAGLLIARQYALGITGVILSITISKVFDGVSDLIYGYFQQVENLKLISTSRMIQGAVQIFSLGLVLKISGSLGWATLAWAVASAACTLFYDIPQFLKLKKKHKDRERIGSFNQRRIFSLIKLVAPLGIVAVLESLGQNIPRYFIGAQLSHSGLGYFAAIMAILQSEAVVINAALHSVGPRLSKYFMTNPTHYRHLLAKLVLAIVGICSIGVLATQFWGKPFLRLAYNKEFAQHVLLLKAVMIAGLFHFTANGVGMGILAARQFKIMAPVYATSLAVLTLSCYWLVPQLGIVGGAVAFGIGALVRLALYSYVILRARH